MAKERNENESWLDDNKHDPKVQPKANKLDYMHSKGFSTRSVIVLGALLIVILILIIIVIVLATLPCDNGSVSDRPLCNVPGCYQVSGRVLQQLNVSVDPCKDFFEFACGGWLQDNPITSHYGEVSVLKNAERQFLHQSRQIVETLPYTEQSRSLFWKLKSFYHSCMDLDSIDSAGDTFLKRHIEQLKGWKPIQTWNTYSWDWEKVLRELHVEYGVFPFFKISVRPDDVNPIRNVIQLSPSGLGLPHPSYYYRLFDDKVVAAYRQLMIDLAQNLGATTQSSRDFANEVFHFEKRIAEAFIKRNLPNIKESEKFTLKELHVFAPRVQWTNHLKVFFRKAVISDNTHVYVTSKEYLEDVSTILSTTDWGSLNAYLIWTLVLQYSPYLSKDYRKAFEVYWKTFTGAAEDEPRWEFCMETTNDIFNLALTSQYVENYISEATFKTTDDVFERVKSSFLNAVKGAAWLDPSNSGHIVNQLKSISSKTHYQDFFLSNEALDKYYDTLSILKTDFLQSVQNGVWFKHVQFGNALRNNSRQYLMFNVMTHHNAYSPDLKQMRVSPFRLQDPLYGQHYPKYFTFGSLGSYAGHGFMKALEDLSVEYSKGGHKTTGGTTDNKYALDFQCITKYSNRTGLNIVENFKNESLLNTIADIEGVKLAYDAFEMYEINKGAEPILPGVSYTPQQLFFVAYAQSMCSAFTRESFEDFLKVSHYLPGKGRVTATLSNVPQFADAYGCTKNVPLNPSELCSLW